MAELLSNAAKFASSMMRAADAFLELVRILVNKPRLEPAETGPPPEQPPAPLALPAAEARSEAAQLLTQHTPGWHTPVPASLPVPTYAPATTAFGIVFIALGAVTVWPLSIIGGLIFVLGLSQWIGELLP